jgi:hypothetical protein
MMDNDDATFWISEKIEIIKINSAVFHQRCA